MGQELQIINIHLCHVATNLANIRKYSNSEKQNSITLRHPKYPMEHSFFTKGKNKLHLSSSFDSQKRYILYEVSGALANMHCHVTIPKCDFVPCGMSMLPLIRST
jgi:hypothetical protein